MRMNRANQRSEDEHHEQRRAAQRREDEQQRREDDQRREDQRREDRQEAAEREARIDARHAHQATLANPGGVPSAPGFQSNKSFAEVPLFSGKND